mgnify:CR=1 FL=1
MENSLRDASYRKLKSILSTYSHAWWAIAIAGDCTGSTVTGNPIKWTRISTDNQGEAWTAFAKRGFFTFDRELWRYATLPANCFAHRWRVGDLVIWDNVALQHGRRDIPKHEARTLQRVTLGDYTPWELVPDLNELLARR